MSVGTAHENENLTLSEQSALGAHAPRVLSGRGGRPCLSTMNFTWRRIVGWSMRRTCWTPRTTTSGSPGSPMTCTISCPSASPLPWAPDTPPHRGMAHWDENKYSLSRRVARFATEHAWTEDPPSRLRHYITNVRTFRTPRPARDHRGLGGSSLPQPW